MCIWLDGWGCGLALTGRVQLACTVVAILLQFLYLSAVGWALLEALHLYRRRSEPRHVDRGPMRFYHVLGWGLPAFITGEPCCETLLSFSSLALDHQLSTSTWVNNFWWLHTPF